MTLGLGPYLRFRPARLTLSPSGACVQTSQGVPVRRFQTLGELIGLYAQPNQGLVCALLLPVERERELDPPDDRDASGASPPCPWTLLLPPTLFRGGSLTALSSPPCFTEGGRPKLLSSFSGPAHRRGGREAPAAPTLWLHQHFCPHGVQQPPSSP